MAKRTGQLVRMTTPRGSCLWSRSRTAVLRVHRQARPPRRPRTPTRIGPIDNPALSQALPKPVPTARRQFRRIEIERKRNGLQNRIGGGRQYHYLDRRGRAKPGECQRRYCSDQERFEYQGLGPTLSINRAQMIEAMPPTPEVIQR